MFLTSSANWSLFARWHAQCPLAPKDELCNREAAHKNTARSTLPFPHAFPAALGASPQPSHPKNRPQSTEAGEGLRIHNAVFNAIHPTHQSTRHDGKPCTCIRPRGLRPNTCKFATQSDARRSARPALPLCTVPCPCSPISSCTRNGLADVRPFCLD